MSETNEGATVTPEENGGEGTDVAENQSGDQLEELQKQLEEREATIGSLKRDLKKSNKTIDQLKDTLDPKDETPEQSGQQPNEPDYAKLAFLNSHQVDHPDDQKVVMDEANRLKLPLNDVLAMEHIKASLETQRQQRTAQDGTPNGSGRKGETNRGDVEYYIDNPNEVPDDLDLHNKVIEAKMKREENATKFSPEKFIG